jgi:orotate phosphoribosyltransferase
MKNSFLSLFQGRHGHFQLESGHHGDLWLQLETLCLQPRKIKPLATQLAKLLLPHKVEMICGPFVEGAFIALLVSLISAAISSIPSASPTARKALSSLLLSTPKP